MAPLSLLHRFAALLLLVCAVHLGTGCDSNDDLNDDIPADPGTTPPDRAEGPLIPSLTLGEVDADNPDRIPLVVGGVGYREKGASAKADGGFEVVRYTRDNLTVVVDGVVQGTKLTVGDDGLKADIAFIIDNTASMSEEISGVRASVLDFVREIEAGGQDVNVGVVAYNDDLSDSFDSGVPVSDTRAHPAVYGFVDLESNLSASGPVTTFVDELPAVAGGDFPELGLGGLDYARRSFSWRPDAQRIYIVITDATAWGRGFSIPNNKGIDADYFTGESLSEVLEDEGSVVHVYSPDFSPVAPPQYDIKTIADGTGGIWTELSRAGVFDLTDLAIIETTLASTLAEFVRDTDTSSMRDVRVVVNVRDGDRVINGERTVRLRF